MKRKLRADWDLLEHNFYRVVSDYRTDAKPKQTRIVRGTLRGR